MKNTHCHVPVKWNYFHCGYRWSTVVAVCIVTYTSSPASLLTLWRNSLNLHISKLLLRDHKLRVNHMNSHNTPCYSLCLTGCLPAERWPAGLMQSAESNHQAPEHTAVTARSRFVNYIICERKQLIRHTGDRDRIEYAIQKMIYDSML